MSTETVPSIEVPNDNSVPARATETTPLGATPQETFRNAMKAEADREGARSHRADPDIPTTTPEIVKKSVENAELHKELGKPSADDIPESLLKPAAPKTEEAPPADDVPPELHGNTSKSVREHFAKQGEYYKAKLAKTGEELATLRKELEAAKGSNGKPSAEHLSALEAIKKERDDYLARLERVAYQESPHFQEKFTAREERLRGVAEKIFEDVAADKSILSQALAMSGKRRDDFLDEQELGPTTKARLASVLGQLDVLAEERNADIATSREKLASIRAEEAAQRTAAEQRQIAEEKAVIEAVRKQVSEKSIAFRKSEGHDEWNKGVDERFAKVEELIHGNVDFKSVVEYAYAAVSAQVTDRLNEKLMAENAALREKLAGMSAVEPSMNGRDKPPASDEERLSKMSPDERARHTFRTLAAPYVGH